MLRTHVATVNSHRTAAGTDAILQKYLMCHCISNNTSRISTIATNMPHHLPAQQQLAQQPKQWHQDMHFFNVIKTST
jgi:hypothetical protein